MTPSAALRIAPQAPEEQPEPCSCPHHVVDPSQMCAQHQKEYCAWLDEQAERDEIQQRYEAQVIDR